MMAFEAFQTRKSLSYPIAEKEVYRVKEIAKLDVPSFDFSLSIISDPKSTSAWAEKIVMAFKERFKLERFCAIR